MPSLLDLRYEASSLRRMRQTLRHHKIHVPRLFREHACKRVIVYEHVEAPTLQELGFLYHIDEPSRDEPFIVPVRGRDFVTVAWWLPTFPGLAILITVLAINLVGDRLRDALDPRV